MTDLHTTASSSPAFIPVSKWERHSHFLPWLALVISLSITYGLWLVSQHTVEHEAQDYFNFRVREAVSRTEQRLMLYEQVLRGAQGFFKAEGTISRSEFRNYVTALKLADNYPGIQGVGFSQLIAPSEIARHVASMHKEGFPDYAIKPEGKRELYTSIIYLEPFADRNLRAFGYDMYSEPVRRAAMERARDTGLAAMSGKVLLVQEARQDIQAGFLIYLPVYRNDRPHNTLAQRRANLLGWVYSPFRMADLMHGIYGEQATDLDIHIYDGDTPSEQALMYDSSMRSASNHNDTASYLAIRQMNLAGHIWTLQITSRPSFISRIDVKRPEMIAAAGVITSLLLALIMWMLINGRRRALRFAQQINQGLIASEQALRESEGKLQAVLDSAAVAIAWADKNGVIEYANHKFTELFGYTLADIPNVEAWYQLAYPDAAYRDNVVTKWQEDIATARQQDCAIPPIEVDITCKNGAIRHVILTSAWVGSDILVSLSDITDRIQSEKKLQRWARIFENAEWGIVVGSADGKHIELMNPAFAKSHGYTTEELMHLPLPELFVPEERAVLPEHIRMAHEQGHHTFESRHLRKDGSSFPVLVDVTAVKDAQGQVLYRVVNVQDISKLKAVEKALLDSRAILQSVLDNAPYLIWLKDPQGRFIMINQSFLDSTGLTEVNEVLGKTDADIWPEQLARKYLEDDAEVISSHHQLMIEEQALKNGQLIWMETFKTPVFDADGKLLGVTGFSRDITDRKIDELKVRRQAHYDVLTGLPNRILFSDRLQQSLAHARRSKEHLAILFIDLDQFKPVNDTFGHDIGDLLLKEVAQRLHACVRESDTAARIGGDEFCVLLSSIASEHDVALVAEKILHALDQPFKIENNRIKIASSIGIALYPKDGRDEQALIKNADIAMYWAKEGGRNNMKFFHSHMREVDTNPPDQQE